MTEMKTSAVGTFTWNGLWWLVVASSMTHQLWWPNSKATSFIHSFPKLTTMAQPTSTPSDEAKNQSLLSRWLPAFSSITPSQQTIAEQKPRQPIPEPEKAQLEPSQTIIPKTPEQLEKDAKVAEKQRAQCEKWKGKLLKNSMLSKCYWPLWVFSRRERN